MTNPDAQARNRFLVISLLRIAGALLVILGLVSAAGRLEAISRNGGIALVFIGALTFSFVPLWLARRWRTPK